ncbi:DUF302 domain-containing protein [Candidatus Pyrohabitans sp.]
MEEFHYTKAAKGDFEAVVEHLQRLAKEEGFGVLAVHDIKESLARKGVDFIPFKIVEICNPLLAAEALKKDINLGIFLPCKVNVYEKDGRVMVSGMMAEVMGNFTSADLGELPQKVTQAVKRIVDNASA